MTWQEAEKVVAKLYNGWVQPGSGWSRNLHKKQDVLSETYLVEVKYTRRDSRRVSGDLLLTVRERAAKIGKIPAFAVVFDRETFAVIRHVDVDSIYPLQERAKSLLVKWEEMPTPWKTEYA